jgi:DNA-directed RNA polymerase specialized sigma24 family protein
VSIEDELREFVRREARAVFEEMLAERHTAEVLSDARFLSIKEAARISGHPEGTLRKWLQRGTLRNYGRHRAPRVRLAEILELDDE